MNASPSSPSSHFSLVSFSSCAIILLTTIIGNFGVSDADVLLRQQHDPPIHISRNSVGTTANNIASGPTTPSSLSSSISTSPNGATAATTIYTPKQSQTLVNLQQRASTSTSNKNGEISSSSPSSSLPVGTTASEALLQQQLYFRLLPSRGQSPTPSSFHKRGVRAVDDLQFLEGSGGGRDVDLGYPLPLSMDDYWALDRERILDQLVIRALANPGEWTELRRVFEKVDGDLKALLALEKRQNQAVSDGTTNSSLGYGGSGAILPSSATSLRGRKLGNSGSVSSSSSPNHSASSSAEHHHHWKFIYHRVHDLNSHGQPTSRGIAAVMSLDTPIHAEAESENENERRNGTGVGVPTSNNNSNSSNSTLKSSNTLKEEQEAAARVISSSHFDDPIEMGGDTTTSGSTGSTAILKSNNNNIISSSNSFSRFGNKGKHVDLASDKSNSLSSDNTRKYGKDGDTSGSALVQPTETLSQSQGNLPNSHKIQWDTSRHGQGRGGSGVGRDEPLRKKEERNDDRHHHHPARHHHHHHHRDVQRDHYFHKNYLHHHQHHSHSPVDHHNEPEQGGNTKFKLPQLSSISNKNQDDGDADRRDAGDDHVHQKQHKKNVDGEKMGQEDELFFPQNKNHHTSHSHHHGEKQQEGGNNNHNNGRYNEENDDQPKPHLRRSSISNHQEEHNHHHHQHPPSRWEHHNNGHSTGSWKRFVL